MMVEILFWEVNTMDVDGFEDISIVELIVFCCGSDEFGTKKVTLFDGTPVSDFKANVAAGSTMTALVGDFDEMTKYG